MPVVVTGSAGQLGTSFRRALPQATFLTRADLDLADATPTEMRRMLEDVHPTAVINCAAYTSVDRAEDEAELATKVNAQAVRWLAEVTADMNVPFVSYSSDYVFSGNATEPYLESSPTSPVNAYGRSKELGERLALEANPRSLIIRTSWLISGTHRNFVAVILERAMQGRVRVVDDQRGCPTVAGDLAAATLQALSSGAAGLLHVTNSGEATWFHLASEAVRLAGLDPTAVEPCTSDDFPTRARRPSYSVLGSERRDELGLPELPDWRDSLVDVVAQLTR